MTAVFRDVAQIMTDVWAQCLHNRHIRINLTPFNVGLKWAEPWHDPVTTFGKISEEDGAGVWVETIVTTLGKANKALGPEKEGTAFVVYHSFATERNAQLFRLSGVTLDVKW